MTPAARVQTAIELLDRIVEAARAKLAVADFTRLDERRRRAIEGAAAFVGGVRSSREHGMGG